MRYKLLCTFAVIAFAVFASGQTKHNFSGKCAKPDNVQTLPAGDKDGHMFLVQQGKCTTEKGEIGGAKSKEGTYVEHGDATPARVRVTGVYTESYDSGDKVFYDYQGNTTVKEGAPVTGTNKWQITGGTGKMKGIKGMGSCTFKGTSDGGLDFTCTGEHTLAAAKK